MLGMTGNVALQLRRDPAPGSQNKNSEYGGFSSHYCPVIV